MRRCSSGALSQRVEARFCGCLQTRLLIDCSVVSRIVRDREREGVSKTKRGHRGSYSMTRIGVGFHPEHGLKN